MTPEQIAEITKLIEATNERLEKLEKSIAPLLAIVKANEPPPHVKESLDLLKSIGPEVLTKIGTVGTDIDPNMVWFKIVTSTGFTYSVKKCSDGLRLRKRDANGELVGSEVGGISPNGLAKALLNLVGQP